MPTEYQYAASEDIFRVKIPFVAVAAFGPGTGNQGVGNPETQATANPTTTQQPLGDALGNLLLQQLQNPGGSGNLGTQEIPISVPSSGPNPFVVIGILVTAVLAVWFVTKKKGGERGGNTDR